LWLVVAVAVDKDQPIRVVLVLVVLVVIEHLLEQAVAVRLPKPRWVCLLVHIP
jgi:hypothetical protein